VRGEIVVIFKKEVPLKEAEEIICRSYKLCLVSEIKRPTGILMFVSVPKGKERKWIRIFKRNDKIHSANLRPYGRGY